MDSSSTPQKEKKGLGRIWNKVKLAIRSKSKSKSKSKATAQTAESSNPLQGQPTQTTHSTPPVGRETTSQPVVENTEPTMSSSSNPVPTDPVVQTAENVRTKPAEDAKPPALAEEKTMQPPSQREMSASEKQDLVRRYERAQAIFKKYNIELDEASWEMHPKIQVERVLKPARIRVRWTCHECKTTFGHDKICVECAHPRCKTCPRYPPKKKKSRTAKKASTAAAMANPSATDPQHGACHECQTAFDLGSQECTNCHHKICDRCLQETISAVEVGETQAIRAT